MLVDAIVGMKAITSVYKGYGDLVNGERRGFCQLWVICTEQYQDRTVESGGCRECTSTQRTESTHSS